MVGVNAAARTTGSDGRALEGQNFAIGIDRARDVLAELRRGRSLAWTGATFGYPTTDELVERKLPAGLYMTGAVPGTPAATGGRGGAAARCWRASTAAAWGPRSSPTATRWPAA